jgi:hypothetical protein
MIAIYPIALSFTRANLAGDRSFVRAYAAGVEQLTQMFRAKETDL